ncbi:MAG: 16S rRNA (adenine(1518)-N(6)/adenine(1519)-N(6))-dimethyltransferase RsmA [Candidatus Cryosericum sp.]
MNGNSVKVLSPSQLRDLLGRRGIVLSKRFGQNFLIDANVLSAIAGLVPSGENMVFIEIGAGALALTGPLAERGKRVVAFEIDERLRPVHEDLLQGDPLAARIDLRYEDALDADWCALGGEGETLVLVGNLPYLRSSEIVLKLIRSACIQSAVLLFQREFATRLVAPPGNGDYSSLSVVAQTFFSVHRLLELPPDVFFPRPEVSSTLLEFAIRPRSLEDAEMAPFMRFVQQAFLHRRKKLADLFRRLGIPLEGQFSAISQLRPEVLTSSDFIDLYRAIARVERSHNP